MEVGGRGGLNPRGQLTQIRSRRTPYDLSGTLPYEIGELKGFEPLTLWF